MRQSEGPSSSSHQRSLFQNSNQDRKKREEATLLQMQQVTTKYLLQMQANSSFFRAESQDDSIPRFQPGEIVLETTIGMGEFGIVLKVGTISLNAEYKNDDQVLRQQLARSYRRIVSNESIDTSTTSLSGSNETSSSATELAPTSIRDTPTNALLVIKQIRKDLYPKKRIEAAKDLAREAKLLARLQQLYFLEGADQSHDGFPSNHPNIISIRGIVSSPGTPSFGILLDRLHLTLTELSSAWKTRQENIVETLSKRRRKRSGASTLLSIARIIPDQVVGTIYGVSQTVGTIWKSNEKHANVTPSNEAVDGDEHVAMANLASPEALLLLGERILAVWDVSEGMGYLHHHKILYRDLKTENVARTFQPTSSSKGETARNGLVEFDHKTQQRMQIFDFGLAKECKPMDRSSVHENSFFDNYKMTGMTGTMRIMAPEVIQCKSYGLPADVYSFGICLWEVFTGTKCNFLSAAEICDTKQTVRPKLPMVFDPATEEGSVGMPKALQELMQACWHEDPGARPSFVQIANILRSCLRNVYQQSLGLQPSNPQAQLTPEQIANTTKPTFLSSGIEKAKSGIAPLKSCANDIGAGALWKKIPKAPSRTPKQWEWYQEVDTGSESNDLLSDSAGFWARLEAMRASGLLDDSVTQ